MKCAECAYCWADDSDRLARCHFVPHCADDLPPCEMEDDDNADECDEYGY